MENGAAPTARERTTRYSPVALPPTSSSSSSSSILRPYRCDTCQRAFREVATLRKHEQLHRADRPYVCQTCGKSFLWSSNLKVHDRVHTGERPYKCKICQRCFTQSNDLRRHERNVHMRGKLYGIRQGVVAADTAGRGGAAGGPQHVNLAAYQAFAMQQRALLQRALTYEGYLHGAQPPLFPHHTHVGNSTEARVTSATGGVVLGGTAEPPGSHLYSANPLHRSPVKMEPATPTSGEGGEQGGGVGDKQLLISSPCQGLEVLQQQSSAGLQHGSTTIGHSSVMLGHSPAALGHSPSALGHSPAALGHSPIGLRHSPSSTQQCSPTGLPHTLTSLSHIPVVSSHKQHNCSVSSRFLPPSSTSPAPLSLPTHLTAPPMLLAISDRDPPSPVHHPPPAPRQLPLISFNGFRHPSSSSSSNSDFPSGPGAALIPPLLPAVMRCQDGNGEEGEREGAHPDRQACDSIMDLSLNKMAETRPASNNDPYRRSDYHHHDDQDPPRVLPALKTPESECEGKRDVTTTSSTPQTDGGIHHCPHCNIVFSDYTMFHLHDSLHLPYHDHPFRCPSCGKHCQDRIEFMFHTVWHVKYPHTIPNYQPFKNNMVS